MLKYETVIVNWLSHYILHLIQKIVVDFEIVQFLFIPNTVQTVLSYLLCLLDVIVFFIQWF